LNLFIHSWNVVAVWRWEVKDDICGICRNPFDACCPNCRIPGDDLVGQCGHCFHLHCIVKWLEADTNAEQVCPMDRQPWSKLPLLLCMYIYITV
ncbi:anaphase-promoting complex subunit 11, partial [Syncephalis plumigaleata]